MNQLEVIMHIFAGYGDMLTLILFFEIMFAKRRQWVTPVRYWSIFLLSYGIVIVGSTYGILEKKGILVFLCIRLFQSFLYSGSILWHVAVTVSFQVIILLSKAISYGMFCLYFGQIVSYDNERIVEHTMLVCSMLISFIFVVLIGMFYQRKYGAVSRGYHLSVLLISLLSIADVLFEVHMQGGKPYVMGISVYITLLLLFFINMFTYILLNRAIDTAEDRRKREKMELLIQLQEEKYDEMSESFQQIQKVIHDTRKHFQYVQNCMENREYEAAQEYIKKADSRLVQKYERVHTGNLAIDAMVTSGIYQAEKEKILLEVDIRIGEADILIDKYDICTALGNLLENAIEGAGRAKEENNKYVRLNLYTEKDALIMETENGIDGDEKIDFHRSSKSEKRNHGYGLQNIKGIVDSYGGNLSIFQEQNKVRITVYIPYRETAGAF